MATSPRALQLYEREVKRMSLAERLQLIKLVINDISLTDSSSIAEELEWSSLSLASFQQEWDNPDDAIYDNWREEYGVSTG